MMWPPVINGFVHSAGVSLHSILRDPGLPDGLKVGSIAVSPRGDLRMPSDASSAVWMSELDELKDKLGL